MNKNLASNKKSLSSIAHFANHLGLSAWTVSRAINGHPEVKAKTRDRILKAMNELGFRPNPMARGLRGRKTGLIGVSVAGLGSAILNSKINHLQEFLREHQLRSLLEFSVRDPENEIRVINDFFRVRVDAMVLIYSRLKRKEVEPLMKGMPCVMIDPHYPQKLPSVSLNRNLAMKLLLEHLLSLGHRRFALLGIVPEDPWRWPGLIEVARERGLDPRTIFIPVGTAPLADQAIQEGRAMAAKVLSFPERPTALIAIDDRVALGAVQALKEAGLNIPRDISVTGFDNLDLARELHPTLTTIEQNPVALINLAGDLLLGQMKASARRKQGIAQEVEPQLILGESTGPAPVA